MPRQVLSCPVEARAPRGFSFARKRAPRRLSGSPACHGLRGSSFRVMQWLEGLVVYAGAVLAWTLGLFVLSRGGLRRIPLLTAAATLSLVVYQVGQALGALAPDAAVWLEWSRRTWWAAALAPGCWLVLVLVLALEEAPLPVRPRLARVVWSCVPVVAVA